MDELLRRAQRRVLIQLLADKGAMALVVMLGGAVLLLLAGTQILDWYWLLLLGAAGFGVGAYQIRGRIPSLYRAAQRIDRQAGLADVLSTAQYFHEHPDPQRQSICDLQRSSAESAARQVDLKSALPYHRSRYLIPASALAMAVLVLFGVRYAFLGSLDLRAPLVAIAMDTWFGSDKTEIATNDAKKGAANPEADQPPAPNAAKEEDEKLPESMMENPQEAETTKTDAGGENKQGKEGDKGKESNDQADKDKQGDQQQGDDKNQNGDSKENKEGDQNGKQGNSKNESSMFDKVRDALANMLNKMKSDAPKQSQNGESRQNKNQQSSQKQQSENKGDSSSQQNSGDQNADSKQEQSDAKGGKPDKPPQQESANSMGDKTGEKTIKDAALLEAMGKITELLGKRQQTLTGEVMVEVGSTKQQLKTPFQQQQAPHQDSGSELHRDEVPLLYQQFVEQYFEEIRRPSNAAPAAKKN
jgi:hypothetical protein